MPTTQSQPAPSLGFVVIETVPTPEPVLPDPFIASPTPQSAPAGPSR